jgi:hypothetical protein
MCGITWLCSGVVVDVEKLATEKHAEIPLV